MGKMVHLGTDVDEEMMVDIDHLARSTGRTHSALVYHALERMIQEDGAMRAFIAEGIESAENEPLIDQAEMEAWFADRVRMRSTG